MPSASRLLLLRALQFLVHVLNVGSGEILESETLVLLRKSELLLRLIDGQAVRDSLLYATAQVLEVITKVFNISGGRHAPVTGNVLRVGMVFQNLVERGNPIVYCRI